MSPIFVLDQAALCGFFAMILFAAMNDASSFKIPNTASIALVLLYPLHVIASLAALKLMAATAVPIQPLRAMLVAGAVFAVGFGLFVRGWVGGGDVKFLAATTLWAGPGLVMTQLAVTAIAGGILAGTALGVGRVRGLGWSGFAGLPPAASTGPQKIPYGVAIAAGGCFVGLKLLESALLGSASP